MLDLSGPIDCLYCGTMKQPFGECPNPDCDAESFDFEMWSRIQKSLHNPARFSHAGYDDFFGYDVRHDGSPED